MNIYDPPASNLGEVRTSAFREAVIHGVIATAIALGVLAGLAAL